MYIYIYMYMYKVPEPIGELGHTLQKYRRNTSFHGFSMGFVSFMASYVFIRELFLNFNDAKISPYNVKIYP